MNAIKRRSVFEINIYIYKKNFSNFYLSFIYLFLFLALKYFSTMQSVCVLTGRGFSEGFSFYFLFFLTLFNPHERPQNFTVSQVRIKKKKPP